MCAQLVGFDRLIQPGLRQRQCLSACLPILGGAMTEGCNLCSDTFDVKHGGYIIAKLSTATSEGSILDVQYPKLCTEIVWDLGFPIAWCNDLLYNVNIGGEKWGKMGESATISL